MVRSDVNGSLSSGIPSGIPGKSGVSAALTDGVLGLAWDLHRGDTYMGHQVFDPVQSNRLNPILIRNTHLVPDCGHKWIAAVDMNLLARHDFLLTTQIGPYGKRLGVSSSARD